MAAAKKVPDKKALQAVLARVGPLGLNAAVEKKLAKLFTAKDADPVAIANVLIDLALETQSQNVRWVVGEYAGPILARLLPSGESLDPRIDALIGLIGPLDDLASTYARIPEQRRTSIWEREFTFWSGDHNDTDAGNPYVDKRPWANHLVERFAGTFLKQCPEAAPFVERYRLAHPPAKPKRPERRLFAPKKPDAPYVFADPVIVDASDWDDFDETQRKQLLLAVDRMTGKKVKSPSGIARALDADTRDDFEVRVWDVYPAKLAKSDAPPRFDCWVFRVDNAVFFKHGTTERVQVYVLQDSFMADDGNQESEKLAADLGASAPETLWAT